MPRNERKIIHFRLEKVALFLFMGLFASSVLSDSGVMATEDAPVHISSPGIVTHKTMPAVVMDVDTSGTIEVLRPGFDRLGSAFMVTGISTRPGPLLRALKANDFPKMASLYRQMVISGNDSPHARLGLATALWLNGDLDDALQAYSWAKTMDPRSPNVHMGMALVMMDIGATDQARQELTSLVQVLEFRAAALNNLGGISRYEKNYELAVEQFSMALQYNPRSLSAEYNLATTKMDMEHFRQAAAGYRRLTSRLPKFTQFYLDEGLALLRAQDPILAAVALNRARDLDPHNPAIVLALGLTNQNLGLDRQASSLLSQALEQNPKDQRIHVLLANSLLRTGDTNRAAVVLEQAFALSPRTAEEHFHQGLKLFLCDRPILASKHFLKSMSMGKKDAELFFALGQSLLQANEIQAAIESLSAASRMKPDSADIHMVLGLALKSAKMNEQAIRELKTAVALKPDDKTIHILLMDTFRDTNDYERCAKEGQALVTMHPELVSTRFDLAFCQAMAGKLEMSLATIHRAIDMDRDGNQIMDLWRRLARMVRDGSHVPGVYILWATIQDNRGNWQLATEAYERFILSNPPKRWVSEALKKIHHLSPGKSPVLVSR